MCKLVLFLRRNYFFGFYYVLAVCIAENYQCPVGFVKCRSSYCIPVRMMCDGVENCADGEDETDCGNKMTSMAF